MRSAKMAAAAVRVSLRRGVPARLLRAGPRPVRGWSRPAPGSRAGEAGLGRAGGLEGVRGGLGGS